MILEAEVKCVVETGRKGGTVDLRAGRDGCVEGSLQRNVREA